MSPTAHLSTRLVLCLGVLLPGCLAAVDFEPRIADRIDALASHCRELGEQRDAWSAALPGSAGQTGCFDILLEGALDGEDCRVVLVWDGEQVVDGRAWASSWSPVPFHAGSDDASWDGETLQGTIQVDVMPWKDLRRSHPDRGRPQATRWTVALRPAVTGQAQWQAGGYARMDPVPATFVWQALRRPGFPQRQPPQTAEPFAVISWWHAEAIRLWQEIRLVALMQRRGLAEAIAREQIWRLQIAWPDPTAEAAAPPAEPASEQPGDGLDLGLGADDDDLGGDDLFGEMDDLFVDADELIPVLDQMIAHAGSLVAHARRCRASEAPELSWGDQSSSDPDFTAMGGSEPVPVVDGVCELPLEVADGQPPRWVHPVSWQALGPVPQVAWEGFVTGLPEMVVPDEARFLVDVDAFRTPFRYPFAGPVERSWEAITCHPESGRFKPPAACKHTYVREGMEFSSFYFRTTLVVPEDHELWTTVVATRGAMIWVDDVPVWRSDDLQADCQARYRQWLIALPLRKGRNEVIVRLDESTLPIFAAVGFCVRGGPRPAAEAAAAHADRLAAQRDLGDPLAGRPQFRRDHSGRYPDADPVLAWDIASGTNVVWDRPLAPTGYAPVVRLEDLLVTTEDPNVLVAIDPRDGAVRWRRRLDRMAIQDPAVWRQAEPLWRELDSLTWGDPGTAERRQELYVQLRELYPEKWSPEIGDPDNRGIGGEFMSTPASDGQRIWALYAGHLLGCWDRDGRQQWLVHTGGRGGSMGPAVNSPVLCDAGLIAQVPDYGSPGEFGTAVYDERGGEDKRAFRRFALRCWDPDSGELRWSTRRYRLMHFGNRYDADGIVTPHVVRLSDGTDSMDVVVTASGRVFRAADGALLVEHLGIETRAAPFLSLGVGRLAIFSTENYHKSGGILAAVELVMHGPDDVRVRQLWTTRAHYGTKYGGYVQHGEILHATNPRDRGTWLSVDAATGTILPSLTRCTNNPSGRVYASPVVAGDIGVLIDDGRNGYNKTQLFRHQGHIGGEAEPYQAGNCSTILAGEHPMVLARNLLKPHDGSLAAPVPDGDGWYLRLRSGLLRIAPTDGGRGYEAETVCRTLLAQLPSCPVTSTAPLTGVQGRAIADTDEEERPFRDGGVLEGFWLVGPIPDEAVTGLRERLDCDDASAGWYGSAKEDSLAGQRLVRQHRPERNGFYNAYGDDDGRYGLAYDVRTAHQDRAGTTCFWVATLPNERHRVVRWDCPAAAVQARIGGVPVAHGERILLPRGTIQVVLTTRLDIAGVDRPFRPRIWLSDDPAAEQARRVAVVERIRPLFEARRALLDDALGEAVDQVLRTP